MFVSSPVVSDVKFSIIIPTYNRPRQLHNCLSSLVTLNYPRELFEVIVVDDGSRTEQSAVIGTVVRKLDISLVKQKNLGPAAARNVGAKHAKGDFLVFIDDDCYPDVQWLKVLAQQLQKNPQCLIGGRTINALLDNPYAATSQLIFDVVYQHYNANTKHTLFLGANSMAVSVQLFQSLCGFNINFRTAEDREFCDRWLTQGYSMHYCADAIVYHTHALTLTGFCRQHFNYGRGAYRFHALCASRQSDSRHKAIKLHSNFRNWLVDPLRQLEKSKRLATAALLILWQVVNALGFLWQAGLSTMKP